VPISLGLRLVASLTAAHGWRRALYQVDWVDWSSAGKGGRCALLSGFHYKIYLSHARLPFLAHPFHLIHLSAYNRCSRPSCSYTRSVSSLRMYSHTSGTPTLPPLPPSAYEASHLPVPAHATSATSSCTRQLSLSVASSCAQALIHHSRHRTPL
jgi:hypothetical protein